MAEHIDPFIVAMEEGFRERLDQSARASQAQRLDQSGTQMIANNTNRDPARMTLANVQNGGTRLLPRTLLYGIDGIGKSTFASQSPSPIFIPTEDGASGIHVPQFPLCESWEDVLACLRSLCREEHQYKTVVLDSADWAQSLAIEHIVARDFAGDMQAFDAYGRGYKMLMQEWLKLLSALDFTRRRMGMEVILISHAVIRTFKNPSGDDYDRYQSNLIDTPSTSVWAKTKEWADIVLFANYEVVVRKDTAKSSKGKGILKAGKGGGRVLHSSPSAAWDAKVRAGWELPERFPLSQEEFRKHIINTVGDVNEEEVTHEIQS